MRRLRYWIALAALAAAVTMPPEPVHGAITPEQKAAAREIQDLLREVNRQVRAKDYEAAGKALATAREQLKTLAGDGKSNETRSLVAPLEKTLAGVERLLKSRTGNVPGSMADGGSFSQDVAPVLLSRCGGCHVNRTRGGLSLASYAAMGRGADGSPVVVPGDSQSSRLVDAIRSGEMPKGGGRVTEEELATLEKWIDAGAKFDGTDPTTTLDRLVPAGTAPMNRGRLMATAPTGNETILYSRDIAPVLVAECTGCHGGNQASSNLSLDSFNGLLRGGNTGEIIVPGKPDESLLIQKLRGMAGARMPLRKPALDDEVIAKFVTWIAEGATFDGLSPVQSTEEVMQVYLARHMSHDELAAERVTHALKNWNLAIPDEKPAQHATNEFLFVGDRPAAELAPLADMAESAAAKFARLIGLPEGEPLIRGRLTFFVLARRFDYGEFAQMVEDREVDDGEESHWRYNVIDAYACVLLPRDPDPARASSLLSREIIGAYIDQLGDVPDWFSRGSALAVTAQLEPRGPDRTKLDEAARAARAQLRNPAAFLTGNVVPADVDPLSYSLVSFLLTSPERYRALLNSLREGQAFDASLQRHYGRDAEGLVKLWPR